MSLHAAGMAAGLVSLVVSPADQEGRFTVEFAPGPQEVYMAGPKAGPVSQEHVLPLPAGDVCEVRSFIGWDHGSRGEANLELTLEGYRLYERSDHKQSGLEDYDAWQARGVRGTAREGALLHFQSAAWMTRPNAHDGGLSTRVEFSIRVRMGKRGCE